jgi:pyrroline-5-carboxylate reductase
MTHRLGIIGAGNMGGAIVRGGIGAGVLSASDVVIADVDAAKLDEFRALGIETTQDARLAARAEQIILAVKPQVFADVARAVAALQQPKVVTSIMAGLSSRAIRSALGERARVIRVMPNMPCQIGAGMSAIALGEGAARGDESLALSIFSALGRTVVVDESLMYAVTAVSGSGPAYIFLLAEAMQSAAERLGIDAPTAKLLVEQTVMGAGKLLAESDQDARALRQAVTSPGGTTAAAMDVFKRREFIDVVIEALSAARDRGVQLDAQ